MVKYVWYNWFKKMNEPGTNQTINCNIYYTFILIYNFKNDLSYFANLKTLL